VVTGKKTLALYFTIALHSEDFNATQTWVEMFLNIYHAWYLLPVGCRWRRWGTTWNLKKTPKSISNHLNASWSAFKAPSRGLEDIRDKFEAQEAAWPADPYYEPLSYDDNVFPQLQKKIEVEKSAMLNLKYPGLVKSLLSHLMFSINCPRSNGTVRTWGMGVENFCINFFSHRPPQKPFAVTSR